MKGAERASSRAWKAWAGSLPSSRLRFMLGPGRIHQPLHQAIDGPLAGRFVIAPVEMDGHPMSLVSGFDHPIFLESVGRIRSLAGGDGPGWDPPGGARTAGPQQRRPEHRHRPAVFLREPVRPGWMPWPPAGVILTDTAMAAAAVAPMARRSFANPVRSVLEWAPAKAPEGGTRTAVGMERALLEHPEAVVLIGSAPTALQLLLDQVEAGQAAPALVVGMPVGFVGVAESKRRLALSGLPQIRLEGSKGGAGMAAAAVNALLRRAWLDQAA